MMNNGKISIDSGRFRIVNVNANAISLAKMKIISIAKTLLASVKMAPLSKNSCNIDNCFSGIILSKNIAKLFIILNFIIIYWILNHIKYQLFLKSILDGKNISVLIYTNSNIINPMKLQNFFLMMPIKY